MKNIVIWLTKPYGYDKHIYIAYGCVSDLLNTYINFTNGYYDEPHKAVEVSEVEINNKLYKKYKMVGISTEHKTELYVPKE